MGSNCTERKSAVGCNVLQFRLHPIESLSIDAERMAVVIDSVAARDAWSAWSPEESWRHSQDAKHNRWQ